MALAQLLSVFAADSSLPILNDCHQLLRTLMPPRPAAAAAAGYHLGLAA